MPTVKKRTDNDGYLKLISKAPDMENSTDVLFTPKPMRKKPSTAKKPADSKPKAPKKTNVVPTVTVPEEVIVSEEPAAAPEPMAQTLASQTVVANLHEEVKRVMIKEEGGSSYVNLGRDMPVHLL